jgi:hypothetical protein
MPRYSCDSQNASADECPLRTSDDWIRTNLLPNSGSGAPATEPIAAIVGYVVRTFQLHQRLHQRREKPTIRPHGSLRHGTGEPLVTRRTGDDCTTPGTTLISREIRLQKAQDVTGQRGRLAFRLHHPHLRFQLGKAPLAAEHLPPIVNNLKDLYYSILVHTSVFPSQSGRAVSWPSARRFPRVVWSSARIASLRTQPVIVTQTSKSAASVKAGPAMCPCIQTHYVVRTDCHSNQSRVRVVCKFEQSFLLLVA